MESDEAAEVELTIEIDGNKRWLVAIQNGWICKVRLPLHVEKMPDEQREHAMGILCFELKRKLALRQGVHLAPN